MYGFGLLGYRDTSFLDLTVPEFLAVVDGALKWQVEKEDRLFEQQSVFVAHLMSATGNLKKGTDFEKLRKQIYLPVEDRMRKISNTGVKKISRKELEENRTKLRDRFELDKTK